MPRPSSQPSTPWKRNSPARTIEVIPSSPAGRWVLLGYCVFVLGVFLLTNRLLEQGQSWVAWVSTAIICATFVIQVRRFPTGEPIVPADSR